MLDAQIHGDPIARHREHHPACYGTSAAAVGDAGADALPKGPTALEPPEVPAALTARTFAVNVVPAGYAPITANVAS
jgi:hypothetical protein